MIWVLKQHCKIAVLQAMAQMGVPTDLLGELGFRAELYTQNSESMLKSIYSGLKSVNFDFNSC